MLIWPSFAVKSDGSLLEVPPSPKCGKFAGNLHPRLGLSYACVLDAGHEGDCQRGGTCFKHGPYVGENCAEWPNCIAPSAELDELLRKQNAPSEGLIKEAEETIQRSRDMLMEAIDAWPLRIDRYQKLILDVHAMLGEVLDGK